jgi:hypothetical protein
MVRARRTARCGEACSPPEPAAALSLSRRPSPRDAWGASSEGNSPASSTAHTGWLRLVVSILLTTLAALLGVIVPVAACLANRGKVLRGERGHVSTVPLVGSGVGFVAVLVAPIGTLGIRFAWSWMPLAIEATIFLVSLAYWRCSGLDAKAKARDAA